MYIFGGLINDLVYFCFKGLSALKRDIKICYTLFLPRDVNVFSVIHLQVDVNFELLLATVQSRVPGFFFPTSFSSVIYRY